MERPDSRGENELTDRYEFIGKIADDKVRRKYVDKSVAFFFSQGNANPIKYMLGKDS